MLDERDAREILRRANQSALPVVRRWRLVVKGDKVFIFENSEAPLGELIASVSREDGSITYSGTYRGRPVS
jgi:hypothetical protein